MRTELKRKQKKQKLLLTTLLFVSILLLYVLNKKLSGGGWMILHEVFYMPTLQDDNMDDSILKRTFYEHKHEHNHEWDDDGAHDHIQEVKFVLRDSDLGSPEFIGGSNEEFFNRDSETILNLQGIDMSSFSFTDHSYTEKNIAIGCAITTKTHVNLVEGNLETEMPFFKSLLPSFCSTATKGFNYNFYIAHDHNDFFFSQNSSHHLFTNVFHNQVKQKCFKTPNITLHLVECRHEGHPAWAQNDAMMAAYMDNMDYYYRLNDDTVMQTSAWTTKFIDELLRFNPPNVGVVGPWFREGNINILTYDFVHRTHIDIFGSYYPRVFTDWYADDWISSVYWPDHMRKVVGTRVKHTMEGGQRYLSHQEISKEVEIETHVGRKVLKRYIELRFNKSSTGWNLNTSMVISMSLSDKDVSKVYGCLRYALLHPFIFPGWRLRVYTSLKQHSPRLLHIMTAKLTLFGVEVVNIENSTLHPSLWPYFIIDDLNVSRFIIRNSDTRPSEREFSALNDWLNSPPQALHCIRDHPHHTTQPLTPALVGGIPRIITNKLGHSFRKLLSQTNLTESFLLNSILWPLFSSNCLCHDSVSCFKWKNSSKFPALRKASEFIGQRYDSNERTLKMSNEEMKSLQKNSGDCVVLKDTGFKNETLVRILKKKVVLYSIDYHTTPLRDLKSLLNPIGVKIIDNSLSSQCHKMNTCSQNLKVINGDNGLSLNRKLIGQFYKQHKDDTEIRSVTSFVCIIPVSMCQLFRPFHKSMLVWASIRYEQSMNTLVKWKRLNKLLKKISEDSSSVVAANNLYDVKYIEYFTGVKAVLIPNYFSYLTAHIYNPTRTPFLLSPIHSDQVNEFLLREFQNFIYKKHLDLSILHLRDAYPSYLYTDLTSHPAIIHVPYQVSMVSLTEQYRMNIPLMLPSIDLLTKWHVKYQVVRSRTWAGFEGRRGNGSIINAVIPIIPDPNDDFDEEAIRYWLKFCDFYQWPHIIYWDSIQDLVEKMVVVDFKEVSRRMREWNKEERKRIKNLWSDVLVKLSGSEDGVNDDGGDSVNDDGGDSVNDDGGDSVNDDGFKKWKMMNDGVNDGALSVKYTTKKVNYILHDISDQKINIEKDFTSFSKTKLNINESEIFKTKS